MKRLLSIRAAAEQGAELRTATFRGADHLVVPVVALVADIVWTPNGADGPEFVPAGVVAAVPGAWDGRPVVPDHPGLESANTPERLEAEAFGFVANTRFEDGKLKMDAWLDLVRAAEINGEAAEVVRRAQEGEPIEVSVGAWVRVEDRAGEHEGQEFGAVVTDFFPDHLAMLPEGDRGACSIDMGCGAPRAAEMRAASEEDMSWIRKLAAAFQELMKAEETDVDIAAADAVSACGCNNGQTAEGGEMEKLKALAGKLVASEHSPFGEDDTEALIAFGEEKLTAMVAACEAQAQAAEPAPDPDPDAVTLTRAEYAKIKAASDAHEAAQAAEKAKLVKEIAEATDAYTTEQLEAKDVADLTALSKIAAQRAVTPNFAGRVVGDPKDSTPALPDTYRLHKEAN